MKTLLRIAALTLAGLGLAGNAAAHGAPVVTIGGPPVVVAPPAMAAPPVPSPYVWQPGYWAWNGYGRTWIEGRWVLVSTPYPAPYTYRRGWERRDWHRDPHGPHGVPFRGYR